MLTKWRCSRGALRCREQSAIQRQEVAAKTKASKGFVVVPTPGLGIVDEHHAWRHRPWVKQLRRSIGHRDDDAHLPDIGE
jgi:hypothetical protein